MGTVASDCLCLDNIANIYNFKNINITSKRYLDFNHVKNDIFLNKNNCT